MSERKLIIFLKAPRPGFVKSRLAATLGATAAATAYHRLVDHLFANLAGAPRSGANGVSPFRVIHVTEIRYAPDDALEEVRPWLRPHWTSCPQGQGDLGERMQRAFDKAFEAGAKRVVLIGSDCPAVTPGDIEQAWAALGEHELVLGPATDGGYWLIGLTHAPSALFESMPWSTSSVLRETLERAARLGLRVHQLSPHNDVDTNRDWREFLRTTEPH